MIPRSQLTASIDLQKDGSRIPIFNYLKGINLLGNIVEANGDSINSRYYGSYQSMLRSLFSLIVDPGYNHGVSSSLSWKRRCMSCLPSRRTDTNASARPQVAPGVISNYETALRDPAFYYFYKYITGLFRQYAYSQPSYKYEDLYFPGVSVKNIEVDPLYTYFDYFSVDVSNAFYVKSAEEAKSLDYKARSLRLNHEPFNYKVSSRRRVDSARATGSSIALPGNVVATVSSR